MLIVAMFYKQNHYEIIKGSLSDKPIKGYYQTKSVFSGCGWREYFSESSKNSMHTPLPEISLRRSKRTKQSKGTTESILLTFNSFHRVDE